MRTINIGALITYLNTKATITAITSNRIFYGLPNTEQTLNYITINKITSRRPAGVEIIERLEFRYIGGDIITSYETLEDLDNKVFNEIENYKSDGVYKVISSNSFNYYNEKGKKCFLRDFIFYKTI